MEPVALQVKVPDAMSTLSSIANVSTALQNLKKAQATYDADVEKAKADSSSAQTGAELAKQTLGAKVRQQEAATSTAETGAQSAKWKLNKEQADQMYDIAGALATHPAFVKGDPDGMVDALLEQKQVALNYGIDPRKVEVQFAPLFAKAAHDPKGAQDMLKRIQLAGQPRTQQTATMAPPVALVNNGQQTVAVNPGTNPYDQTQGQPGATGLSVQAQLPPTTQVFNPETKAPELLGPQPTTQSVVAPGAKIPPQVQAQRDTERVQILKDERSKAKTPEDAATLDREISRAEAQLRQQFDKKRLQAGPALGEEATAGILPATVKQDWDKTVAYTQTASQDIGVLQNIKKYAKSGAITGAGADRRALINGIGDLLGIPSDQLEKTNTDLLAKNANMLALVGGNTDAARALAEAANPNIHMNEGAIRKAADQIIAQKKTGIEKQKFLQPYVGDPKQYTAKLTEWNAAADPRIFQLSEMTPKEKGEFVKSLSDKEYSEFKTKVKKLHDLGVSP